MDRYGICFDIREKQVILQFYSIYMRGKATVCFWF